ncbi:MAG: hypothetical protein PHS30_05540 [Bacteroidales bacterium]|nr:hypothetical protein [Bacteroidales bacterium]
MSISALLEGLITTIKTTSGATSVVISGVAAVAFYKAFGLASDYLFSALNSVISGFSSFGPFGAWAIKALMIKESFTVIMTSYAAVMAYKVTLLTKGTGTP